MAVRVQKGLVIIISLIFYSFLNQAYGQTKFTINGTLKDSTNGEAIIGGTVSIKEIKSGISSNVYGFYSITLPSGSYTIEYTSVGYKKIEKRIDLNQNRQLNINLAPLVQNLKEVTVVTQNTGSVNVNSIDMSVNKLDIKTIQKLPALLGEVDIVKSLQFLPGVSQVGEGSSGFNVRGGSVGQNLVLLDEAPIYNSSHMLGFFSVFNPDAVKDVKLYKGAIPAQYGGRTSSVLDVRLKEGNQKKTEIDGGIGFIFSRLAVQGPLIKDKASFLIAARRSYIDAIASALTGNKFGLNFYDLTLKANYTINPKNGVYLSGFLGRDNFGVSEDATFNWGNKSATLRWNSVINSKLFANVSAIFSNYNYNLGFNQDDNNKYKWHSSIATYFIKPDFNYFISNNSEIKFGFEASSYGFDPSNTKGVTNGQEVDNSLERKHALETAAYLSHLWQIIPRLEIQYGLRFSHFDYLGAGTAFTYNDTIPGKRRSVASEKKYEKGQRIASYQNPEPRFSLKFNLDNQRSFKASYARTTQYVQFISNTTASNPLNIWTPSTNNLKPTLADQFTLGYFLEVGKSGMYEASVETYYKRSFDEVDYINGAELLSNAYLEGDLLSGQGRAYGMEFYLQKKKGDFTGWLSYTLSRSELKINGINKGNWYPTRYDQTHNLKLVGSYTINKQWSATADFVFTTGTPITYPNQRIVSQGYLIPYNSNDSRNDTRVNNFNRLDLSLRMEGNPFRRNGQARKNRDYVVFSIYNVYGQKNTFSNYFVQSTQRTAVDLPLQAEAHRVAIIGTMVPSVSYNFKF